MVRGGKEVCPEEGTGVRDRDGVRENGGGKEGW